VNRLSTVSVCAWITVLLVMTQAWHNAAGSGIERIQAVSSTGDEQIVYSWYTDRCADQDIPVRRERSGTIRAMYTYFRRTKKTVHLLARISSTYTMRVVSCTKVPTRTTLVATTIVNG